MTERDMMYGGYYQNIPGNMMYGNYGMQLPPGALMQNSMMMPSNNSMNNPIIEINNKINSLENRIKVIEQKLSSNSSNPYQDDNSLYML